MEFGKAVEDEGFGVCGHDGGEEGVAAERLRWWWWWRRWLGGCGRRLTGIGGHLLEVNVGNLDFVKREEDEESCTPESFLAQAGHVEVVSLVVVRRPKLHRGMEAIVLVLAAAAYKCWETCI